ncbi:MAG: hypothetical protein HYV33_05590 [Candidatus Kerfeldbacteria bacterium]|nr:hypothetical protein [Candidatus Kerfeldbacteria bacterium]
MDKINNHNRGWKFQFSLWRRWLKFHILRLQRQQASIKQIVQLIFTHGIVRPLERYTHYHVRRYHGQMPREFKPRGAQLATVVLGVGFGQVPAHAYWFARRLSRSWSCRVLVLRTPNGGNVDIYGGYNFYHRLALLNQTWVAEVLLPDYQAGVPIIGLGFSKGGQDLTVLAHQLLQQQGIRLDAVLCISTPWQGSRLWAMSSLPGAEHFKPDDIHLKAVEALGQQLRARESIIYRFFCATKADMIVHPSEARFSRPAEDDGISLAELRTRWYYARPLWCHFGHTALFNFLVYIQIGLEIRALVQTQRREHHAELLAANGGSHDQMEE